MARDFGSFGMAARPFPAVLWLAAAISIVAALSPRDLWAPDEPRAGVVARAMVEGGDWLVPHMDGEPYPEKPPLVYWLMAISGILFGQVTAVAARLPGALATACAVFSVARLARRWFGDASLGDTAALLFATTELVLWNGSRAGLDMPMTAFVLLAVEAGTAVVAKKSLPGAIGFGAALGCGLLAKGPHALYVPIAAIVGGCMAVGAKRRLLDWRWLLGLSIAAGLVCAWLLPAIAAGGKDYGDRLLGQLGDRLSGEASTARHVPHENPWWHMPPLLLAVGLPWTLVWLGGLVAAWRSKSAPPEDRFGLGACLGGVIGPIVLLSIPASKRDLYLIPLLPLLAILAAYALHRTPSLRWHRWSVRFAAAILAAVAVGALAAPWLGSRVWPGEPGDAVTGATLSEGSLPFALGAIGLVAAAGALLGWRGAARPIAALRVVGIAFAAVWLIAVTAILPAFDDAKTFRVAAAIAEREAPNAQFVCDGFGRDPSTALWSFHRLEAWSANRLIHRMVWPGETPPRVSQVLVPVTYSGNFPEARVLWRGRVSGTDYILVMYTKEK